MPISTSFEFYDTFNYKIMKMKESGILPFIIKAYETKYGGISRTCESSCRQKGSPIDLYTIITPVLLFMGGIWAIFLRADIICLQLVKIDILDPLGGVLYTLLQFCSCWIYKIQVWRHLDLKDPNSEN